MSKPKTIPVLLTLAAAMAVSACNLEDALDPLRGMSDICADDGSGEGCPPPPEQPQLKNP